MASIMAGDIRKGTTFEYNGKGVYTVTEFQHVKPGKGAAFVRATLKNVVTGQVLSDVTFNPTAKLETAQVETRKMTYSYTDGEFYYFMDPDTFEMTTLNFEQVEEALKYIKENRYGNYEVPLRFGLLGRARNLRRTQNNRMRTGRKGQHCNQRYEERRS